MNSNANSSRLPSHEEISARAYALWEKRGHPDGQHHDTWIAAEEELFEEIATAEAERARPGDINRLGDSPPPSNLIRALPAADRARARATQHPETRNSAQPFSNEHFFVVLDRARLRIYTDNNSSNGFSSIEPHRVHAVDFPLGHEDYFTRDSDRQGRFHNSGSSGGSSDERLPQKEERERRIIRLIIASLDAFFSNHPRATWDLAAEGRLQHAVLEGISANYQKNIRHTVAKDLSKHSPAQLPEHFAATV